MFFGANSPHQYIDECWNLHTIVCLCVKCQHCCISIIYNYGSCPLISNFYNDLLYGYVPARKWDLIETEVNDRCSAN